MDFQVAAVCVFELVYCTCPILWWFSICSTEFNQSVHAAVFLIPSRGLEPVTVQRLAILRCAPGTNHLAYLGWTVELETRYSSPAEKSRWWSKHSCCSSRSVDLVLACPEDSLHRPTPLRSLTESQRLQRRPWRSAQSFFFFCQFAAAEQRRLLGVFRLQQNFVQIGPFSHSTLTDFTTMVRCQIAVHDLRITGR